MSRAVHWGADMLGARGLILLAMALGVGLSVALLSAQPPILLAVVGGVLYVALAAVSFRQPLVFVAAFLVVLVILPPFFLDSFGETPLYVSNILVPIGLGIAVARFPDFKFALDPVARGLGMFLGGLGLSLPFAFWFSGVSVGIESLSRWLLLAQTALIYLLIRGGASVEESRSERWMFRLLLGAAVLSAAYGIFDFVWPVPLPHPAADQFIWLGSSVLRRAQGVFYESSNFANLCGFFLAAAAAGFLARGERRLGVPRSLLLLSTGILSLAVLVAFSRSAWASVATTLLVFVVVYKRVKFRRAALFFPALGIPVALLWIYSPELWNYLVNARVGSLAQIFADPNLASSGRFDTWARVWSILGGSPQYLLFGVGYKTLPYTRQFHDTIIVDNGYLSLLLETGIVGFGGFLVFTGSVLRTFFGLAREREDPTFWPALLFSFWWGECVQMLAADAYTYWRNMAVFTAFMALALNRAERERRFALPDDGFAPPTGSSRKEAVP